LWQPWQAPSLAKSWRPAATLAGSRPVTPRGERMVCMYALMAPQSPSLPAAARPSGLAGSAAFCAEPLRPALLAVAAWMSMRSAVAGGVDVACTMAPTPPETPRVLSSKSATSSKMPVQLKMRWSLGFFELNEPSRLVDWRGPRAKYQVTLSV